MQVFTELGDFFRAIGQFFVNLWNAIGAAAKSAWAGFMAAIVAVLTFLGINVGGNLPPEATTVPTTPTSIVTIAPQSWDITLAQIQTLVDTTVLDLVEDQTCTLFASQVVDPPPEEYIATGVLLKDLLAHLGADMNAINANSVLNVICTDPTYPDDQEYSYSLIIADDTILALSYWDVGKAAFNKPGDVPRMFPVTGFKNLAVKQVCKLTLNYN